MTDKVSLSSPPQPEQFADVATEQIVLPSRGLVYPEGSPLCDAHHIDIKPMTAKEEDILTSRALVRSGKAIDALLRSCLVDRRIDPMKMLVGDRNSAMIGIRITGYGQSYEATIACPSCGSNNDVDIDLAELPIKGIPDDVQPIAPHLNEFAFRVPSGRVVNFRLPTGADDAELSNLIERLRKTTGAENLVTSRLMQQVVSIDGEPDKKKLSDLIRNMPAKDSRALRAFMDHATPDVRWISGFSCGICGAEIQEVEVPLGTEFFWPRSKQ